MRRGIVLFCLGTFVWALLDTLSKNANRSMARNIFAIPAVQAWWQVSRSTLYPGVVELVERELLGGEELVAREAVRVAQAHVRLAEVAAEVRVQRHRGAHRRRLDA